MYLWRERDGDVMVPELCSLLQPLFSALVPKVMAVVEALTKEDEVRERGDEGAKIKFNGPQEVDGDKGAKRKSWPIEMG